MFVVLTSSDEYSANHKAIGAGDRVAAQAAIEACCEDDAVWYRCVGIFATEAEAKACASKDENAEVAYFFPVRHGDGKFAVAMGDNGWGFANSSPSIVIGMFATRKKASEWAKQNGSEASCVFEIEAAQVERLAA
jgi:streptogramin lyase